MRLYWGWRTRLAALPLIFTMLVAYFMANMGVVKNLFSEPDKFTEAAPFLFLLASMIVFVFRPGDSPWTGSWRENSVSNPSRSDL